MHEGTWTPAAARPPRRPSSSGSSGSSELTAAVLVRRGYGDPPPRAASSPASSRRTIPSCSGTWRPPASASGPPSSSAAGSASTATTTSTASAATALAVLLLRELGADVAWHLPSRFDEGYGVRSETLARLAEEGCGLVLTVDCGITAVDEVAEARELGLDVVVTDHHRPGETLPDCPVVATRPSELPVPRALRHRRRLQARPRPARRGLGGPAPPRPRRARDDRRRRPARRREPLARDRRAARARAHAKPGLRALMQAAGVDPATVDAGRRRLPPRAAHQRGRPPRPSARRARAAPDRRTEARLRRLADSLEELNRERQAVEDRILREAVAQVEAWPRGAARPARYVVAGEDWHEGVIGIVASRLVERYHRPVVLIAGRGRRLEGLRPLDPRLRPARGARRVRRPARALGRPSRRGGAVDPAGERRRVRRGVRRARRRRARRRRTCARRRRSTPSSRAGLSSRSTSAPSSAGSRRSVSETQRRPCSPPAAGSPSSRPSATASICASASGGTGRDAGSAIAFGQARSSTVLRRDGALRRRLPARGEPLERHGRAAARRSPRPCDGAPLSRAARVARARVARSPAAARDPEAAAIFAELGLDGRRPPRPARICSLPRPPCRGAAARARRVIRLVREDDWPSILEVHRAAFGGDDVPRIAAELHGGPTSMFPSSRSSRRRTAASWGTS